MLKKSERYSFKEGLPRQTFKTPLFTVRYQKNEKGRSRAAVVVSKKVSPLATTRNRVRRIVSGLLKEKFTRNESGSDLVLYVKKEILHVEKSQIEKDLDIIKTYIYGNR